MVETPVNGYVLPGALHANQIVAIRGVPGSLRAFCRSAHAVLASSSTSLPAIIFQP